MSAPPAADPLPYSYSTGNAYSAFAKFDGKNYFAWRRNMETQLKALGQWEVVDGTISAPTPVVPTTPTMYYAIGSAPSSSARSCVPPRSGVQQKTQLLCLRSRRGPRAAEGLKQDAEGQVNHPVGAEAVAGERKRMSPVMAVGKRGIISISAVPQGSRDKARIRPQLVGPTHIRATVKARTPLPTSQTRQSPPEVVSFA